MSATRKIGSSFGRGHSSSSRLEQFERKARNQQIAAQKAWLAFLKAQVAEDAPWSRILAAAIMTGVKPETLRKQLDVSPSTYSRWLAGHHAPSVAFRKRLGEEIIKLGDVSKDEVPVLDQASQDALKLIEGNELVPRQP